MSSENDATIAEMWEREEAKSLEERRSKYQCRGNFVTPDKVINWENFATRHKLKTTNPKYPINNELNQIIALYQGNITALEVDAIQNAANKSLLGGGGIDGAIHKAAGNKLVAETMLLNGCETGETKISRGYNLPAKYVLHTVGPIGVKPPLLKSCYKTTLELAKKHQLRSIALCGVSTGVYGYPVEQACPVVLKTIRKWLLENENYLSFDKIIFVQFADREMEVYKRQLPIYFPVILSEKSDDHSADILAPPPPPPGTKTKAESKNENVETAKETAPEAETNNQNVEAAKETAPEPESNNRNVEAAKETAPEPESNNQNVEAAKETAPEDDHSADVLPPPGTKTEAESKNENVKAEKETAPEEKPENKGAETERSTEVARVVEETENNQAADTVEEVVAGEEAVAGVPEAVGEIEEVNQALAGVLQEMIGEANHMFNY